MGNRLNRFFWRRVSQFLEHAQSECRPLIKHIKGENNRILVSDESFLVDCKFEVIGDDNVIRIGPRSYLNGVHVFVKGSGCRLDVGVDCRFTRGSLLWMEDDNCLLTIGAGSTFVDVHIAVTEPGSECSIGKDCMLAYDIDIRTGDSHSILDLDTGKRLNLAKNVILEDHVWIAAHVQVLKGVTIHKNSIVSTGSVVTKSSRGEGRILGGVPAKEMRSGVTWTRDRI